MGQGDGVAADLSVGAVAGVAFVAVLEELTILADALIGGTVGALIGGTLAYRRQRRGLAVEAGWLALRRTWAGIGRANLGRSAATSTWCRIVGPRE